MLIYLLVPVFISRAQLSFPVEEYYHRSADRFFLTDSTEHDFYNQHLTSKPILQERSYPDSIFFDNSKQYYWITQKLFKENFLIFKGEDFWCAVDPIVDVEGGKDLASDSSQTNYWNTRGIRVQAKFLDKIGFVTTFYENQAMVPGYQSDIFQSRGEYILAGGGTTYKQVNAVVPGYARTKSFKTSGYDFAFAEGYFTAAPSRYFKLDFGNGSQFIGNGYRSLLLSDNAVNFPFLKLETNFWNNRVQFHVMYTQLTNLFRLEYFNTPEATYERKWGSFHFAEIAVTKNILLGFFEGSVWRHTDSLGTHPMNGAMLNPVPFINSLLIEDSNYNQVAGMNICIQFARNILYSQILIDHGKIAGYQVGFKSYDIFIPELDFLAEYNHAAQNAYLSNERRYNYSHYNSSLAHPLGSGFDELIFKINYQYNRWFFSQHITYSAQLYSDSINTGSNILLAYSNNNAADFDRNKVFYSQTEAGYQFNKRYNLQLAAGYIHRQSTRSLSNNLTDYVYLTVRTRLRNKRFDY